MRAALVIPPGFDPESPRHRAERQLAIELLSVLEPRYRIEEVRDPDALDGCAFAVCILDRALAVRCATRVPTRLAGSDTLYFNADKWRLTFYHPKWDPPPGTESTAPPGRAAVYFDHLLSHETAAALGARVRGRHPDARLLVSKHLHAGTRAALERGLGRPTVELVAQSQLVDGVDHLISTDPATLQLVRGPRDKTLISTSLGFHDASRLEAPRQDLFLYKGEELDETRLATVLLSPGEELAPGPRREYQRPLISVVVPIYDRTGEIRRLADSLLVQRYSNLEVLFVTNGSPPETLEAVREASARLLRRGIHVQTFWFPRAFGSATIPRDIGCYAARGAFLCLLDSDDYLEPGFFDWFLDHPMADDVLYSPKRIYRDAGRRMGGDFTFDRVLDGIGNISDGLYPLLLALGNVFQNSGVIISREAFVRAGGIDHGLRYCEDYYLWLRVARAGASTREHDGRVSITFHAGNNELAVGDPDWFFRARAAADREHVY